MTHIEEEHTTTTTTHEEVEPAQPRVENLNVNTKGDTVTINQPDETPDETSRTHTETTHTEVRQDR
jgi:hypothetical protein